MKDFVKKLIERLEEEQKYQYEKAEEAEKKINLEMISISEARRKNGQCFDAAIQVIEQLAEEYRQDLDKYSQGWIPCSERLPDDFMSFEYLTIRKGHTLATITYYCVANHKWYSNRNSTREIEVIAWQPLPAPFKQERTETHECVSTVKTYI